MGKWLKRALLALLVLVLVLAGVAWWLLRGSLPALDGERAMPGLHAAATIQRDALGVVTIDAASEADAMRALGYVHAQERFFEMDLMRRNAAGELSELFGKVALETDQRHRIHRMRARVQADLAAIAGGERDVLGAYVEGVNAGVGGLRPRPWPYLLLRKPPAPWQLADSPLVGEAMYFDLQDAANKRELALWKLRPTVPAALFALLARDGTEWDAPLLGQPRGDATLPTAAELDLRRLPIPAAPREATAALLPESREVGSNSFAASGALTADGRAIVADDMHLDLRAPNIWFRARLRYPDPRAPGGKVDVQGFTLPGLPLVVVGSNGHVAWGFTNSYADRADWWHACDARGRNGAVVPCEGDGSDMPRALVVRHEKIAIAGQDPVDLPVEEIDGHPVLHKLPDGSRLALDWAAHAPGALNLRLAELATAADVPGALAVADAARIPTQNMLLADADGHIAWTLVGYAHDRTARCDPWLPAPWPHAAPPAATPAPATMPAPAPEVPHGCGVARGRRPPVLDNAAQGRLWTANNRTLYGALLERVGDGGYAFGARGRQIRDDLFARKRFAERDLLAIQLDDRALFMRRWWQLLRDEAARTHSPSLRALSNASAVWQGRAQADSVSYRVARAWRLAVHARLLDGLTAPAQAALGDDFVMPDLPQFEGVAWPLVTQRPAHLLPRRFACDAGKDTDACGWDALFEDAATEVRKDLEQDGPLGERTWGERNTARICHPLSRALPGVFSHWLCMPAEPLDGDSNMPRVVAPAFGASERMVVAPGHEADGIVHMPGGQSGHPMSPFWGAGHEDWVHGKPTPFLPGATKHVLRLRPAR